MIRDLTLDQEVWVRALTGVTMLCSLGKTSPPPPRNFNCTGDLLRQHTENAGVNVPTWKGVVTSFHTAEPELESDTDKPNAYPILRRRISLQTPVKRALKGHAEVSALSGCPH